jgi:hypothetical protein
MRRPNIVQTVGKHTNVNLVMFAEIARCAASHPRATQRLELDIDIYIEGWRSPWLSYDKMGIACLQKPWARLELHSATRGRKADCVSQASKVPDHQCQNK